jgi:hypothetical protein
VRERAAREYFTFKIYPTENQNRIDFIAIFSISASRKFGPSFGRGPGTTMREHTSAPSTGIAHRIATRLRRSDGSEKPRRGPRDLKRGRTKKPRLQPG